MVPDAVANLWDNPSIGGEGTTGGESESGSGSECDWVQEEEEEFLTAKMIRLQLQNEAEDAGEGPSTPPRRTRSGRVVKQSYKI